MRLSGFSLLLAAVSALAALACIALPLRAGEPGGGTGRIEGPPAALSARLRPAETPPPDFSAGQYIDSAGCVFVRTDGGWQGRIDRDGSAVCGYPPTLSARRIGPDSAPDLFREPEPPRAARIERELTEAIIPNLHAAELAGADPHGGADPAADMPATPAAPAGHPSGQPAAPADPLNIAAAVAHAPAISRQVAGASRTDRLCALIGEDRPEAGDTGLGLCGGTAALAALSRSGPGLKDGSRADSGSFGPKAGASDLPSKAAAKAPDAVAAAKGGSVPRTGDAPSKAAPKDDLRMIPPGARFVQVGSFRKAGQAQEAAERLARTGVPVVRAKEGGAELVMVGPLDGREGIVRMIERLRRAGYRDLRARR